MLLEHADGRYTGRSAGSQKHRQAGSRQADGQTDRPTHRQTGRETERQTDRDISFGTYLYAWPSSTTTYLRWARMRENCECTGRMLLCSMSGLVISN